MDEGAHADIGSAGATGGLGGEGFDRVVRAADVAVERSQPHYSIMGCGEIPSATVHPLPLAKAAVTAIRFVPHLIENNSKRTATDEPSNQPPLSLAGILIPRNHGNDTSPQTQPGKDTYVEMGSFFQNCASAPPDIADAPPPQVRIPGRHQAGFVLSNRQTRSPLDYRCATRWTTMSDFLNRSRLNL